MKELTTEEAIAKATDYLLGRTGIHVQYCHEHAREIWGIYSRVRPAAPEPEVMYGPCELRSGVWADFGSQDEDFITLVCASPRHRDRGRYVRVGDVPACPPTKPAPPMPEGPPPKRIIARKDGKAYHGAITGEGIVHIFGAVAYLNADYARNCGWEIEILEGRDDGK